MDPHAKRTGDQVDMWTTMEAGKDVDAFEGNRRYQSIFRHINVQICSGGFVHDQVEH